jgi:hypothetical protein
VAGAVVATGVIAGLSACAGQAEAAWEFTSAPELVGAPGFPERGSCVLARRELSGWGDSTHEERIVCANTAHRSYVCYHAPHNTATEPDPASGERRTVYFTARIKGPACTALRREIVAAGRLPTLVAPREYVDEWFTAYRGSDGRLYLAINDEEGGWGRKMSVAVDRKRRVYTCFLDEPARQRLQRRPSCRAAVEAAVARRHLPKIARPTYVARAPGSQQ